MTLNRYWTYDELGNAFSLETSHRATPRARHDPRVIHDRWNGER